MLDFISKNIGANKVIIDLPPAFSCDTEKPVSHFEKLDDWYKIYSDLKKHARYDIVKENKHEHCIKDSSQTQSVVSKPENKTALQSYSNLHQCLIGLRTIKSNEQEFKNTFDNDIKDIILLKSILKFKRKTKDGYNSTSVIMGDVDDFIAAYIGYICQKNINIITISLKEKSCNAYLKGPDNPYMIVLETNDPTKVFGCERLDKQSLNMFLSEQLLSKEDITKWKVASLREMGSIMGLSLDNEDGKPKLKACLIEEIKTHCFSAEGNR